MAAPGGTAPTGASCQTTANGGGTELPGNTSTTRKRPALAGRNSILRDDWNVHVLSSLGRFVSQFEWGHLTAGQAVSL